jgi:membrane associated rhomboid family serine protease
MPPNPQPVVQRSGPHPPIFNLPPGVKFLILVLITINVAQHFMPAYFDLRLESVFGYVPQRFWALLHGGWRGPGILIMITPLTYMFLHAGWAHLALNVLSLAAFGTAVETRAGEKFMIWVFLVCGVIGAFSQLAADPTSDHIIVGASAGISGLFAVAFLTMSRIRNMSRMRRIVLLAVMVAVLAGTGIGGIPGSNTHIAWVAHIGGFLAGAVAEACISSGGAERDIRWFATMMALPLFTLLLIVAR